MRNIVLGDRLLLSRRSVDIDQRELARRSGVSATYISKIERGHVHNVTIDVVFKLAEALDLSVGYLLGLTDIPSDEPGTPLQTTETTLTFEVKDRELRRIVQELIAILVELAPEDRQLVFDVAERMWRIERRESRIVGD